LIPQSQPLPFALAAVGWALFALALAAAAQAVRRGFLRSDAAEHAWLGGAVCVALLWTLQVRVAGSPAFGMLGCALYALLFGYSRGLLGLTLAVLLHAVMTGGSWVNLGLEGLLLAVVPAAVATLLREQIERRLPHNPFVFMIGNGMFSTLAATAVTRLALVAATWPALPLHPAVGLGAYLAATMLMAWSEAIVSGMLLSALVVFRPEVVLTYREELYARPRR
jgi:uncharacterized membrane protein